FDPDADRAVSSNHARIVRRDGFWWILDEGSRNGTFVNGAALQGERRLEDGDRIEFGAGGPAAVFRAGIGETATGELRRIAARQTRRLAIVSIAATVTLATVVTAFLVHERRQRAAFDSARAAWTLERDAMQRRIDDIIAAADAAVRSLQGEVAGLATALEGSRAEVRTVRDALAAAESSGDTSDVPALRRQLQAATAALDRQRLAASLDFRDIESANRRAVARVFVETASGTISTGTAFAI